MSDSTVRAAAALEPPLPGLRTALAPPTLNPSKGVITEFLEWFGDLGIFFWRVARAAVTPPFELRELFRQLDEIGSMSLPLVAAAGAAIASASAAETAILMILLMRNQPRRRHVVPGARLKASAASKLQEAFTHSIWALMALR